MARGKDGTRVTFVVPDKLLGLADVHAEEVGLDRYDVIRSAIAKGLLVLRMEHEVAKDPARYAREFNDVMQGSEVAAASARKKLETDVVESMKKRIKRSDAA